MLQKILPYQPPTTISALDEVPNKPHHIRRRVEEWVIPVAKGYSMRFGGGKSMSDNSQEEHKYDMMSRWVREKIVTIEVEGKPELHIATPPDFWPESPEKLYSPEDLFVASAVSCYGVSLTGVAKRFHGEFKDFHLSATGTLHKGEFGWEFEQISINAKIFVETEKDRKRMTKAAERAHEYCLVTNSMKCPIHLNYEVILE